MSRKYIKQIINQDFVYPNNEVSEYDIELVHNLNNNSPIGTVTGFTATSSSTTGITFSHYYKWELNNSEPWIRNSNEMGILSVHAIVPGQIHYKPWRVVDTITVSPTFLSQYQGTNTFTITPSQFGLSFFTNGTYYFEIRFISHLTIDPICINLEVNPIPTTPTPTPMPSPTPTPMPSPTPEPTPPPVSTFSFCGRGNTIADSCNDAIFNSRTFYSDCSTSTFGVGCYVYTDSGGTIPLTGYSYVFMNGANWDVNSSTGVVTAYSATQC